MPPTTTNPAPAPIRSPPGPLVNQIAASEVVERPASVVKELTENSLDAGAKRIRIDLEQGGIELIQITDDGGGIPRDQLPMALAPHATSKISVVDDLDRIATLGFRGEALASIASVSRLSIRSRTADDQGAWIIEAEGDKLTDPRPASGPIGTCLSVRNLFFNTPARRKFLRTPTTEQTRCVDAARNLAMAHPAIGFTITCDGRTVEDLPPNQSPKERALAILGNELADQLIDVHADQLDDSRGIALWGLAGLPSISRSTNQSQHVFINGRVIRDKTIQHAIKEAYRGLIEPGRHATVVLMLEMNPGAVDVNVHPSKVEVRFRDSGLIHSVVLRAIRDVLRAADLTPTFGAAGGSGGAPTNNFDPRAILPETSPDGVKAFVDYFRREAPTQPQGNFSYEEVRRAMNEAKSQDAAAFAQAFTPKPTAPLHPAELPLARPLNRVLQVHNSYLVTQDEQGVVILDQHALHERVMFEHLIARIKDANLESQRLLSPVAVPASPSQMDKLPDLAPLFTRIGVEAEPLGPVSLGIHAFPSFLFSRGVDPVEFMTELLEKTESEAFTPGSEQTLHEVLDMMACKAAVKAGDRMTDVELDELIRLREAVERSSNCPHGRPTTVRLTIRELEKLFQRR